MHLRERLNSIETERGLVVAGRWGGGGGKGETKDQNGKECGGVEMMQNGTPKRTRGRKWDLKAVGQNGPGDP